MTPAAITSWAACARCQHGSADGTRCRAPQLVIACATRELASGLARQDGLCGSHGRWHLYRPAGAGAPPLEAAR